MNVKEYRECIYSLAQEEFGMNSELKIYKNPEHLIVDIHKEDNVELYEKFYNNALISNKIIIKNIQIYKPFCILFKFVDKIHNNDQCYNDYVDMLVANNGSDIVNQDGIKKTTLMLSGADIFIETEIFIDTMFDKCVVEQNSFVGMYVESCYEMNRYIVNDNCLVGIGNV